MAWLSLEELKKYDAKKELEKLGTKKAVAKATPSLRSQGHPVEVVRDTGLKNSLKSTMEKRRETAKTPGVKINTDRGFTVQNTTINPRIGWKPADMTKSTAKDEKTRLYETNDSLLNPQEIIKKYSYVAQDRDMDYGTLRRAVNKGMQEVGRTLRGTNDNSQYEKVAKLQAELQGRLKSASFTAGMLEGMGGSGKDALVRLSGNEALQKQNEAMKAQMEAAKANHSGTAAVGQITGELLKPVAGYMSIGNVAESLTLKGAGKLGQRMAAATAADGAQKLAAKVLLDPKKAKAAGFATRMLAQQAADTLVNTPITIINGTADGKSRKEILQDFGKQEATDAAFNLGLAGLGAGAKALKNRSRKGPIAGIDFEKIGYDRAKVDEDLVAFKKGVDNGTIGRKEFFNLEPPNDRLKQDIKKIVGFDVDDFKTDFRAEEARHIEGRHGKNGEHDQSMADENDLAKIQYILNNYDGIARGKKDTYAFRNSDNTPAKTIEIYKRINGTYYVVEAVPDSKNKRIQILSAYKSKKRRSQVADASIAPAGNVQNANGSPSSDSSILPKGGDVKVGGQNNGTKQIYQENGFAAATIKNSEKEITRYTNPKIDKSPMEMDGVKEIMQDVDFGSMGADTGDYSAAMGIKPMGFTFNKDIFRIWDEAGSKNPETAKFIDETCRKPLLNAKEEWAKDSREFFGDILQLMKETGIQKGSRESAAAQWYGEGYRLNKFGEKEPYTITDLKQEFPNKWQDIIKVDEICRKKHLDSVPVRVNANFEKIYPNVETNAISEMKKHTAAAEDYTAKAAAEKKRIEKLELEIAADRKILETETAGSRTATNAEKRIITKERQIAKSNEQMQKYEANADERRKKAKQWEDDIASGEIYANKRLLVRKNYYPHMEKKEKGFLGLKRIGEVPREIDPRLEGISEFTEPKTKWAGFMQHRRGGYYDADAIGNTLEYMQEALYKIHFDPLIAQNRKTIKGMAEATKDSRNANGFINAMLQFTNDLAGKTNPYFDRMLTNAGGTGRKMISALQWLNNRAKSNAVMGNVRSAVAQFYNLPNAAVYIKNPTAWAKGTKMMADSMTKRNGAREIFETSTFLTERYDLDKLLGKFDDGILQKPEKLATWMLTAGDEFSTRLIWSSAYHDGLQKGVADAVRYADDVARKSVGGRGIGEIPIMQKSKVYKFFIPFSLEINNSLNVLKDAVKGKELVGLAFLMAGSYAMNSIPRELFGFDVSTDFINAFKEGIDEWDEKDKTLKENLTGVGGRVAGELISAIPSGALMSSIVFKDANEREKFFGESDPTRYGTGQLGINLITDPVMDIATGKDASSSLLHTATAVLPSFGGRQIERGFTGLQDMGILPKVHLGGKKGISIEKNEAPASYTDNGELRFPIDNTTGNVAKLFAFGRYATKEGKAYIDGGNKVLDEKATATYDALVDAGAKNTMSFETINRMRQEKKAKEQRRVIRSSLLSDNQKAILYHSITEKDSADRRILDHYQGTAHMGKAADCLMRMADYEDNKPKKYILQNTNLPDAEKKYIYLEKIVQKDDREKETKRVDALLGVGISMNDYIQIRTKYGELYNKKMKGLEKQQVMVNLMNDLGLSGAQQAAVKGQLLFGGGFTSEWKI